MSKTGHFDKQKDLEITSLSSKTPIMIHRSKLLKLNKTYKSERNLTKHKHPLEEDEATWK